MEKNQLEIFARSIMNEQVYLYKQTKAGKWYEQEFRKDFTEIEPETVYGVYSSSMLEFTFKTGKNADNYLKTFVTQYISKYATKRSEWVGNDLVKPTKEQVIEKLRNNNRVSKYLFYTTLYGIGWFCFLSGKKSFDETNEKLSAYLKSKGISFMNEFSEAGWVYRFVLNKDVEVHNRLLSEMSI